MLSVILEGKGGTSTQDLNPRVTPLLKKIIPGMSLPLYSSHHPSGCGGYLEINVAESSYYHVQNKLLSVEHSDRHQGLVACFCI